MDADESNPYESRFGEGNPGKQTPENGDGTAWTDDVKDKLKPKSYRYYMHNCNSKEAIPLQLSNTLEDCNFIRYAAYRVASKLIALQRYTEMDHIRLEIIDDVFLRHEYMTNNGDLQVSYASVQHVLSDLYLSASREYCKIKNTGASLSTLTKILIYALDVNKEGILPVWTVKVFLAIFCRARLPEKLDYIFTQLVMCKSDKLSLGESDMRKLFDLFDDILNFLDEDCIIKKESIDETLNSTSYLAQDTKTFKIDKEQFCKLFYKEPMLLAWLPTFYRIKTAESEIHNVSCSVCGTNRISGLRYRCLKCSNYNQCQMCFFVGSVNKKHKIKHIMQEYCWPASVYTETVTYLKDVLNRICKKSSHYHFLPVQPALAVMIEKEAENECWKEQTNGTCKNDNSEEKVFDNESSVNYSTSSSGALQPEIELSEVISVLERKNRELDLLSSKRTGSPTHAYLTQHKNCIDSQINRLKDLKNNLMEQCYGSRRDEIETCNKLQLHMKENNIPSHEMDECNIRHDIDLELNDQPLDCYNIFDNISDYSMNSYILPVVKENRDNNTNRSKKSKTIGQKYKKEDKENLNPNEKKMHQKENMPVKSSPFKVGIVLNRNSALLINVSNKDTETHDRETSEAVNQINLELNKLLEQLDEVIKNAV